MKRVTASKEFIVVDREPEGWYITYRNSEWKNGITEKWLVSRYLEHKIKLIELLLEAGYVQKEKS